MDGYDPIQHVTIFGKSIQEFLTLDNIFKYASEDELRAIVSSIIGRLNMGLTDAYRINLTDKDLDKFVKALRDVK